MSSIKRTLITALLTVSATASAVIGFTDGHVSPWINAWWCVVAATNAWVTTITFNLLDEGGVAE